MKTLYLLFITALCQSSFGQFAIISDKDGHSNVRSSAEAGKNITDTLYNGQLVYCFETTGNWTNINYRKNKQELNGYIYSDRLISIDRYEELPLLNKQPNVVLLGKDSIKVTVAEQAFNKINYRFSYYKDAPDQIELINRKQYWGTDGGVPKTEYKSITISFGKKKILLPKTALENLFQPSLELTKVYYDRQRDILYIQSDNSDGAGYYSVIWKIEKKIYKSRFVAYGF